MEISPRTRTGSRASGVSGASIGCVQSLLDTMKDSRSPGGPLPTDSASPLASTSTTGPPAAKASRAKLRPRGPPGPLEPRGARPDTPTSGNATSHPGVNKCARYRRRCCRAKRPKSAMGTSWWLPSQIEAAVTRAYVLSQLLPDEIERLDRPVAFGDEHLTERTYWDSIREDAPRLFLILVDLGVPDQIFGVIDDGWDDAELPIALDDVDRLQLTAVRDDRVNRKFYNRQFHYLLKPLERGSHQAYGEQEVVPLDVVERASITPHKTQLVDKVKLPNVSGTIFCRRRYPLRNSPGYLSPPQFLDAVQNTRSFYNDHVVSYWASYTHQGQGYVLYTPTTDLSLKSFLSTTPSSFKSLSKKARRELIMNWILCLADTVCFLHHQDRSHCCIKPSTILFNTQSHICLADSTRLTPGGLSHHTDKSSFDREWYDYAAPEQWFRPTGPSSPPSARMPMMPSAPEFPSDGFDITQAPELSNSPMAMLHMPTPQLSPQQADIFSLGCIILELLSFLVKRSTSKFASFRSAKHKTAGRGGAVLDTSFHRNLGQVEAWMSNVAKDASKKTSDAEGGNAFRGVTPMLHVVTSMLSANPYDRPPAIEVQQRIYQVVTEVCGIQEPHCVHQYSHELDYALGRMRIQTANNLGAALSRQYTRTSTGHGTPRSFGHSRESSSGEYSQNSRTTNTTSDPDVDADYNAAGPSSLKRPGTATSQWSARDASYLPKSHPGPASLYTADS